MTAFSSFIEMARDEAETTFNRWIEVMLKDLKELQEIFL